MQHHGRNGSPVTRYLSQVAHEPLEECSFELEAEVFLFNADHSAGDSAGDSAEVDSESSDESSSELIASSRSGVSAFFSAR
jgi:hypothetical protein